MLVHYRVHKIPPLDPNLGHTNQLYPNTNYSWNISFNNMTPTNTTDDMWSFPTDVATEILYALPISLPRDRGSIIPIFDSPCLLSLI